jgi:hypothetical protein
MTGCSKVGGVLDPQSSPKAYAYRNNPVDDDKPKKHRKLF